MFSKDYSQIDNSHKYKIIQALIRLKFSSCEALSSTTYQFLLSVFPDVVHRVPSVCAPSISEPLGEATFVGVNDFGARHKAATDHSGKELLCLKSQVNLKGSGSKLVM